MHTHRRSSLETNLGLSHRADKEVQSIADSILPGRLERAESECTMTVGLSRGRYLYDMMVEAGARSGPGRKLKGTYSLAPGPIALVRLPSFQARSFSRSPKPINPHSNVHNLVEDPQI